MGKDTVHTSKYIDESILEFIEEDDNDTIQQTTHNQNQNKPQLWITDFYPSLYSLHEHYQDTDSRLMWIGMTDILYGKSSCNIIRYDKEIKEFINVFLDEINSIIHKINDGEIIDEHKKEYNILKSLNHQKMYSRISYRFQYFNF